MRGGGGRGRFLGQTRYLLTGTRRNVNFFTTRLHGPLRCARTSSDRLSPPVRAEVRSWRLGWDALKDAKYNPKARALATRSAPRDLPLLLYCESDRVRSTTNDAFFIIAAVAFGASLGLLGFCINYTRVLHTGGLYTSEVCLLCIVCMCLWN